MEEQQRQMRSCQILLLLLCVCALPSSIFTLRVNPKPNDPTTTTTTPVESGFNFVLHTTTTTAPPSGGGGGGGGGGGHAILPPALFLFGDSLCDTGNGPFVNHPRALSLPFGMTFPGYAIGRFSDGREIVPDFLAEHLGLHPLNPWLNVFLDFDEGANYAIPGATTLASLTPFSLGKQVSWHLDLVDAVYKRSSPSPSPSPSSESSTTRSQPRTRLPTVQALHDALYVIQIGGLDYRTYYSDLFYPPEFVNETIVPLVVEQIRVGLETLYHEGHARNFIVAGVGAQGCLSSTLSTFLNMTRDFRGCAISVDDICDNSRLQTLAMLHELHELHPDANYSFADFYSATHYIIDHAHQFGFTNPLDACCGAGPTYPYGFHYPDFVCSNDTEALYVCPNPVNFINWDGIHFTDSFNFQMFNHTFLTGFFMYPIDGLSGTSASKKLVNR